MPRRGRTSAGSSRLARSAPPLRGYGLDRRSLVRQRLAKRSWLEISETAPSRPEAQVRSHGPQTDANRRRGLPSRPSPRPGPEGRSCHFGCKIGYWRRSQFWTGGEGDSQSPLKDKAFSTVLDQNPPLELRRKLAFRFQSFHEIHRGSSKYWPNPSISVGGGQQDGLAFALRRQRSHVRSCRCANQTRSVPKTWVTVYTEDMGNTFGPKGFATGSSLQVSSSKYPRS